MGKPNTPPAATKPRKKRAGAFVRRRVTPTEEVVYTCDACPDCGRVLSGGWEYSRRQIIELPAVVVRTCDHVVQARYCGVCAKTCVPTPDLSALAVGRSAFGPHVHSLVAYLRQRVACPYAPLQACSARCAACR